MDCEPNCLTDMNSYTHFIKRTRRIVMEKTMDKIIALAKARGFVYPGSEIYGGLANTWDYGNLGVELKNNVKRAWWQKFIQESPYNVGVDCAILMNPQTWVASGHLGSFSDPLMDCKECHERFRADKIIEDFSQENGIELESSVDGWSQDRNDLCTTIDVDFKHEKIKIKNYTDKIPLRAFGVVENPTWEDFQWFLKDRCFPETRAHLKWVLSDVGVPFYDPLMIIEKTKGKMAEDQQWIEVIHRKAS